jgi:GT2 family glycosyltransferase
VISFDLSKAPEISVATLVTREPAMVRPGLEALAAALPSDRATEVIVVLNTTRPDTRSLVLDGLRGARVIDSPANCGTAVAWNVAAGAARAPWLAIVHEDTQPPAGWLDGLVSVAEADRRALAVGSRIYNTDGSIRDGGWITWRDAVTTPLDDRSAPDVLASTAPYLVDFVGTASMLLDRAGFMALGGFDERTFPTVTTNIDLALAAWEAGRTSLASPRSRADHASHAMVHAERGLYSSRLFREFLIRRATDRLRAKWGDVLDARYEARTPGAPLDDPADHARALQATARRAATPAPAAPPPSRQLRHLSAPDGGWPDTLTGARERLLEAQNEVDRAFDRWVVEEREQLRERIVELDAGARAAAEAHDNALRERDLWRDRAEGAGSRIAELERELDALRRGGRVRRLFG